MIKLTWLEQKNHEQKDVEQMEFKDPKDIYISHVAAVYSRNGLTYVHSGVGILIVRETIDEILDKLRSLDCSEKLLKKMEQLHA